MGCCNRQHILLLVVGGIVSTALLATMAWLDQPLRTTAAPRGIVSLELAGSHEKAHRIIESWGPEGHRNARLSLWLDYGFLVGYALVLSLLCWMVAIGWPERFRRLKRAGFLLGGCQWAAALLDIIENIMLQKILAGSTASGLPLVARWSALIKFTLIAGGWLYILLAGGIRVIHLWRSQIGRCDH